MARLLLSVSDTLPWGGVQGVGGWVGQGPFQVVFGRHAPPPPLRVGLGFSWVLDLRALGLRGIEIF